MRRLPDRNSKLQYEASMTHLYYTVGDSEYAFYISSYNAVTCMYVKYIDTIVADSETHVQAW